MNNLIRLRTNFLFYISFVFLIQSCSIKKDEAWVISAPAGESYTAIYPDSITVIPNGKLLTPRGRQIMVAPHPYGLALSPDGTIAVTANSGVKPFSISIIRNILSDRPEVQQIPPGAETDEGILAAVFMGLAISPDNRLLYVGGGQEGKIFIFDLTSGDKVSTLDCNINFNGKQYEDSYIGDLILSADGNLIYAVDQTNFRAVILDTKKKQLVVSVDVGRYPFGITLSPDGKRAYVANVGMFEYSKIVGADPDDPESTGLKFPPFAYLSKEAEEGMEIDGYKVPGLGDPNVPESFSVWVLNVENPESAKVTAKIKTGNLVGQKVENFPAVGGASPSSLVATEDRIFVSNGNNDLISVIDSQKDTVIANIKLILDPRLAKLRGAIPFGLALSPNGERLYVAEAGLNAVAVIDVKSSEVLGHIPVGWFPSKLAVSKDGRKLIVANAKGFGSGPNGGANFHPGTTGSFIGNLMNGTVSVFDIPEDDKLQNETQKTVENNFKFTNAISEEFDWRKENPVPLYPGEKDSPIKHIIFIVKENRTFDEVFGGMEGVVGDPAIARYGSGVSFSNKDKSRKVENARLWLTIWRSLKHSVFQTTFIVIQMSPPTDIVGL